MGMIFRTLVNARSNGFEKGFKLGNNYPYPIVDLNNQFLRQDNILKTFVKPKILKRFQKMFLLDAVVEKRKSTESLRS